MRIDPVHLKRALRKVESVSVGTLADGSLRFETAGDLQTSEDPSALCWEIGSITKVFTGILLAEMAGRGEVGLDDPIGRFAPGEVAARLPSPADQPRLVDLATHTAGLPRLPLKMVRAVGKSDDPYSGLTPDDVWEHLGPKTRRPPRPRHRYSNYGMGLLGHLLERAVGADYGSLLTERVLVPLGMTSTGLAGDPVAGYRKKTPTPAWTFGALAAAGGLRSTPGDLLRLAEACLAAPDGPLGETLMLSFGPHHRARIKQFGLGWMHRPAPPGATRRRAIWHNGGTYGTASFLAVDREGGCAVVAFGNRGPVFASPIDRLGWAVFDDLTA